MITSSQHASVLNVSTNYWQIIQMIFNRLHAFQIPHEKCVVVWATTNTSWHWWMVNTIMEYHMIQEATVGCSPMLWISKLCWNVTAAYIALAFQTFFYHYRFKYTLLQFVFSNFRYLIVGISSISNDTSGFGCPAWFRDEAIMPA